MSDILRYFCFVYIFISNSHCSESRNIHNDEYNGERNVQHATNRVDDLSLIFSPNETFSIEGVIIQEYNPPDILNDDESMDEMSNTQTNKLVTTESFSRNSQRELTNVPNSIEHVTPYLKSSRSHDDKTDSDVVVNSNNEMERSTAERFSEAMYMALLREAGLSVDMPRQKPPSEVQVGPPGSQTTSVTSAGGQNKTNESYINATAFFVENDEIDNSLTDLQTLFLACFATLAPLILSLIVAFGVRFLWRKYRREREVGGFAVGVIASDASTDPLAKTRPSTEEMKNSESQFSIAPGEVSGSPVNYTTSRANHTAANGSIITMTLKNNHLIVETEERNDIVHDSRETALKYSPDGEQDVFVVEVQHGGSPSELSKATGSSPEPNSKQSNQVIVHHPPDGVGAGYSDEEILEIDEDMCISTKPKAGGLDNAKAYGSANTGLSQSDLSLSSSSSYRYGDQQSYETGHYGYPIYDYNETSSQLECLVDKTDPDPDKPVITAAIYKQESIDQGMGYSDRLLSDVQARATRIKRNEDEKIVEEQFQEEQRRLGNDSDTINIIIQEDGDSKADKTSSESDIDSCQTVIENTEKVDVFNQLKEAIVINTEPQFEKLCNEATPVQEVAPDLGKNTSGEQYDNMGFVGVETSES